MAAVGVAVASVAFLVFRSKAHSSPGHRRRSVVLFGDSLTQRGWEIDGWVAGLAIYYTRHCDVIARGYGGARSSNRLVHKAV